MNNQEPMLVDDDDSSLDELSKPKYSKRYAEPLHCQTVTASVLRNYRHNPMIGGDSVALQLSPNFIGPLPLHISDNNNNNSNDDSNPPGLTACDTDSASDSGIDDISLSESIVISPLKPHGDAKVPTATSKIAKEHLLLAEVPPPALAAPPLQPLPTGGCGDADSSGCGSSSSTSLSGNGGSSRKTSISFMDSSNPLLTAPFLMDLCNDDYNMSTSEFLDDNELEQVLGWTNQLG